MAAVIYYSIKGEVSYLEDHLLDNRFSEPETLFAILEEIPCRAGTINYL